MEPMAALLIIIGVFAGLAFIIARVDGLAFLAPKSTRGMRLSAQQFCTDRCRSNGQCPLTNSSERAANCPLFKYIDADVPTAMYGSPFETVKT
jgi:hypothetical protein